MNFRKLSKRFVKNRKKNGTNRKYYLSNKLLVMSLKKGANYIKLSIEISLESPKNVLKPLLFS